MALTQHSMMLAIKALIATAHLTQWDE